MQETRKRKKTRRIIIILDGIGDIPYKELGNKTPLEKARTPNLDALAKNGKTGLLYPIKNIAPESGSAQFAILGCPIKEYPGRGPLEAMGIGVKLKKHEIALRCNFANINGKKITNVRAKIPSRKLLNQLNKIHPDIKIIPTILYRAVMIVKNASKNISNTHPGYIRYKNISKAIPAVMKEKQCTGCKATAKKINYFLKHAKKLLKNKTILIRGAGFFPLPVKKLKSWAMIADMPVELGIGRLLSMKILKRSTLKNTINQIINYKRDIYVQIKGPDIPSHTGNKKAKIKEIEKIDRILSPLLKLKNCIICITSDHATPCALKRHSQHPVPLLIYGKDKDSVKYFSEKACKNGSLGKIEGKNLMKLLYDKKISLASQI